MTVIEAKLITKSFFIIQNLLYNHGLDLIQSIVVRNTSKNG